jgi:hypothetical protein
MPLPGLSPLALDHHTMLGPQLRIQSADTLRRLLAYLGATSEQLAGFDNCHRRWGQGTIQITLQPCRKILLKIDYQRLYPERGAMWRGLRTSL